MNFSKSAGISKINGPLLFAEDIGLVMILVTSSILFSISTGLNKSKQSDAYSS